MKQPPPQVKSPPILAPGNRTSPSARKRRFRNTPSPTEMRSAAIAIPPPGTSRGPEFKNVASLQSSCPPIDAPNRLTSPSDLKPLRKKTLPLTCIPLASIPGTVVPFRMRSGISACRRVMQLMMRQLTIARGNGTFAKESSRAPDTWALHNWIPSGCTSALAEALVQSHQIRSARTCRCRPHSSALAGFAAESGRSLPQFAMPPVSAARTSLNSASVNGGSRKRARARVSRSASGGILWICTSSSTYCEWSFLATQQI